MKEIKNWLSWSCLIASPVVILFLVEVINRQSSWQAVEWLLSHGGEVGLSLLLLGSLTTFFWLLFNNLGWANLLTLVAVNLLAVINYFKILYRGEPIYPQDFQLWRELLGVVNPVKLGFPLMIILVTVLSATWVEISFFFSPKPHKSWGRWSIVAILIVVFILAANFSSASWWQNTFNFHYNFQHNQQVISYQEHGLLTSFMLKIYDSRIVPPVDYNEQKVRSLAEHFSNNINQNISVECQNLTTAPLIIMVMSESWIDPSDLTKVDFIEDILPNYHHWQKQTKSGRLLVKTIGGGTSETEFEALTGFSNSFHPPESEAYINYIKRSVPALPIVAKNQGYRTYAIHPYHEWFWRRNEVYPLLGFDQFVSLNDFDQDNNDNYRGNFISDQLLGDYIIEVAEKAVDQPKLIWAVSMQNHAFYEDKNYLPSDYELLRYYLTSDWHDEMEEKLLLNYLVGAHDADQLLGRLIDYFQDSEQPVVIAFFGDHWPIWNKGEFLKSLLGDDFFDLEKIVATQQTPFLLWSNFHESNDDLGLISSFAVAPLVAQESCLPLTNFWQMLLADQKQLTGYNLGINVLPDGSLISDQELPQELQAIKNDHWLWQYDLLFGRQYAQF